MKRLLLVLVGCVAVSVVGIGCEPSAHDRYRQMTYRRASDGDALGVADDFDAGYLLADRPTHLSTWFNR